MQSCRLLKQQSNAEKVWCMYAGTRLPCRAANPESSRASELKTLGVSIGRRQQRLRCWRLYAEQKSIRTEKARVHGDKQLKASSIYALAHVI